MSDLQTALPANTWLKATWENYLNAIAQPTCENAKGYYYDGQLRIEMSPVSSDHASDHTLIAVAVNLFGILRQIPLQGRDNCSYRRTGLQECQPDLSYYIGDRASIIPYGTSIVDLNRYPPPDLVIEVANTSLADDWDRKRKLYQEINVTEYWVLDVQNARILGFAIAGGKSKRIKNSRVLPGLALSVLEEALRRSRSTDQSRVGAWLMAQFQQ
ncbi:MAG: Uma2 family endonuclease [Cyanobacteriota bacterium]|nr:Uma2 family endonuclease [Cyanobacteriota bacterium]